MYIARHLLLLGHAQQLAKLGPREAPGDACFGDDLAQGVQVVGAEGKETALLEIPR
jgi:hypothetical protein